MKNKPNYKKLAISILLDLIGMLSFVIPFVGEFGDVVWAPLSGWIMTRMYKGTTGKIAGAVTFIEEILPGVDIIPSFTLMWIYASFIEKDKMLDK
ncbi:hypothetical protein [Imtechella halotolerans]|uniref:Uncharacterized protein n=1 Tax=Imtechella halotolerans K1 TaxID=946077 RepID=I0W787_9FLAO|nr:hypothetical protein [Imtechella halotolerans]EID72253.1 hypothetical protein W5A_12136 [Imtechella halotolerans K1]WMQ64356.1 hypothetical protein PT603_05100 [Imtechella halotolerans]